MKNSRTLFISLILQIFIFLVSVLVTQNIVAQSGKPNVVIFYADDLGWGDLSINNKDPKYFRYTPNIDKIFTEGVQLGNYSTHCVCSPSRAGLLTAKHYANVMAGPRTGGELPYENTMTLGKEFQSNGYETGAFGKWHNSEPNLPAKGTGQLVASKNDIITDNEIYEYTADKHFGIGVNNYGFDSWAGYYGGGTDMFNRFATQQNQNNWWVDTVYMGAVTGYTTDLITDAAVDFIIDNKDNNFLCYVPEQAVHHPIHVKKSELMEFCEKLESELGISGEWDYVKAITSPSTGKTIEEAGEELKCWKGEEFDVTQIDPTKSHFNHLIFGTYLYSLDKSVGRIMDTLDSQGLIKNTIILFTSDNGGLPEGCSLPYQGGKHSIWEGGVHVPAAIWWPGTFDANTAPYSPGNNVYSGSVSYYDIYPTLMAMTENSFSVEDADGINFWDALQANTEIREGHENPLFEMWGNHGFVRTNEWKLIYSESDNRTELYHYKTDTAEAVNVSHENVALTKELRKMYKDWLTDNKYAVPFVKLDSTNVHFPNPNPDGEILEVKAWQTATNGNGVFIRFSNGDFVGGKIEHYIEPGDRVEYDIYVADDSEQSGGIYYSPGEGWKPLFDDENGLNQDSLLVHNYTLPKGKWIRNVVGTGTLCPGTSTVNYIVFRNSNIGYYHFYIDNVVIRKSDGTVRSVIWQNGSDMSPLIYRYKNVNHNSLSNAKAVSGFPFSDIQFSTLKMNKENLVVPFEKYIYKNIVEEEVRVQEFTISNFTTQPVEVNSISLEGDDASFFEISEDPISGTALNSMMQKGFSIEYKPGTEGEHSAFIVIDNELNNDTIRLISDETVQPLYRKVMDNCDASTGWGSNNDFSVNNLDHQEGGACIESSGVETNEFVKSFNPAVVTSASVESAYLQFWYYVSDINKFATNNQFEIGSGGKNDIDEFNWNLTGKINNGWNQVTLKFSDAGINGNPDINNLNWLRVYHGKTGEITTRLDNIIIIDSTVTAPEQATDPEPANNAEEVNRAPQLLWTPGNGTESSDIFFGDEEPLELISSVSGSSYKFSYFLDMNTTYYWRIDGRNEAGSTKGTVWSFTTKGTTSGINTREQNSPFDISPNPSTGRVSVSLNDNHEPITITVYDLNGRNVLQESTRETIVDLDLTFLNKGLYIIEIKNERQVNSKKLMLE